MHKAICHDAILCHCASKVMPDDINVHIVVVLIQCYELM